MAPPSHVLETPAADPTTAARHFAAKLSVETDPSDVHADLKNGVKGFLVLDARSPEGYATEHIPGAINLHHRRMDASTVKSLPKDQVIVVYCAGTYCNASTKGAANLAALGYRVKELIGGLEGWKREGYPTETGVPVALPRSR